MRKCYKRRSHESAPESRGMDGLELVVLGNVDGTLSGTLPLEPKRTYAIALQVQRNHQGGKDDGADDRTSNDARGRDVTVRASLASGESCGRSWWWCWSLSSRSIVDRPKRGEVRYQELARASRRCSSCCGQQHALHASSGTFGTLLIPIVLVLGGVNRHARGCQIASNWVRE